MKPQTAQADFAAKQPTLIVTSRLITTTVAGNVSRLYQNSQNGNLVSPGADGLLTTFTYDGRDNRRRDGLRFPGLRQLPGGLNGLGCLEQGRG
jgi:hypothetical protein